MKTNTLIKQLATLSILTLTGVSYAAGIAETKEELETTTLNALYEQTPALSSIPSAYQLEEVLDGESANILNITKYLQDPTTNTITPVTYNVVFNSRLGDSFGTTYYFKWVLEDGMLKLKSTTSADIDILAKSSSNTRVSTTSSWTESNNISNSFLGLGSSSRDSGGAIYNKYTIGNITGDFIGNYSYNSSYYSDSYGGAIYSEGEIGNITGDFIGNYSYASYSASASSYGGAIYSEGEIGNITGDFIGNYSYASSSSSSSKSDSYGGAIYNSSTIGDITGDFIGNYSYDSASYKSYSYGGAIYNSSTIGDITGDFIGNYSYASAYSYAYGGAIYNSSTIGDITGDFIGNYSYASGAYASKSYSYGGAIYNSSTIGDITGDFIGNYSYASSYAYGGAIYNKGEISFLSLNENMQFTGNYTKINSTITSNAIYNTSTTGSNAILNFNAFNGCEIIVNDGINGGTSYMINQIIKINEASLSNYEGAISYSTVQFNNEVKNQIITVYNGTLQLGSFAGTTLNVNDTEQVVESSIASLYDSGLIVNNGATLNIATNSNNDMVKLEGSNTIIFESNSTLNFDMNAGLYVSKYTEIEFNSSTNIIINLADFEGDFNYTILEFEDNYSSYNMGVVYSFIQNNLDVISDYSTDGSNVTWTLSTDGNYINISGYAVPEPSTYAMIFGSIALGLAVYRRRK